MTGWRLGWLVGPADVIEKLLLLHAAILASVPTFIQDAGVTALSVSPREMAQVYARRRAFVCKRLTEMGLTFPEPKGAFYAFPDISRFGLSDEEFCTRLITEGGVATVPGSCFGTPGHIRISYCCSDATLAEGMNRLERFLQTL
jgi:aminotransferase